MKFRIAKLSLAVSLCVGLSSQVLAAARFDAVAVTPLGAPSTGWRGGLASGLNDQGQVAYYSDYYVNGVFHGERAAFLYSDGVMTNLGSFGANSSGVGNSYARALNESGQVAGYSEYYVNGVGKGWRAFLYSNGVMTNLGSLGTNSSGVGSSYAQFLNESGQVAGYSEYYVNGVGKGYRAFLYSNGVMTNLGSLGTNSSGVGSSYAQSLNESGQVAGYSEYYVNGVGKGWRAFLYSNGMMTNLGSLGTDSSGGGNSFALFLNESGQVAGFSQYYVNGVDKGSRAFLYSNGVMTNLGSLGTNSSGVGYSSAQFLNESGQVVGSSEYYVAGVGKGQRAFLYSNGVMTNLGSFGTNSSGVGYSSANGLNESGQVVGQSNYYSNNVDQGSRAFLYNQGTLYDLNQFAANGWVYTAADKINSAGQVVIRGTYNGNSALTLFTPHPDWQGGSGNWSDASHWNYAGMGAFGFSPSAPHKVVINPTTSATINGPANATVTSLSISGSPGQTVTFNLNNGAVHTAQGTTLGNNAVLTGSGQVGGNLVSEVGSHIEVGGAHSQQYDSADIHGTVHSDGNIQVNGAATFHSNVNGAGSFSGPGSVSFAAGSTYAPGNSPALTTFNTQASFASGSIISMELGGTLAGTQHDKIIFNSDASLAGDLELQWYNSFSAQAGDTFDLFDWNGAVSGSFANVFLPTLANGLVWNTSDLYAGGNLAVAAVPEPETYVMLALGLTGLAFMKRRQRKLVA